MKDFLAKIDFKSLFSGKLDFLNFLSIGYFKYVAAVLLVFFIFLRWWGIKKLFRFILAMLFLLWSMVKVSNFVSIAFGSDSDVSFVFLTKLFFVLIMVLTFIYFCFLELK